MHNPQIYIWVLTGAFFVVAGCKRGDTPVAARKIDSGTLAIDRSYDPIDASELPLDANGNFVVTVPSIPGSVDPPPAPDIWHWVNIAQAPPPTLDTQPSQLSDLCAFLSQNGIDFGTCGSSLGYTVSIRSDLAIDALKKLEREVTRDSARWNCIEFLDRGTILADLARRQE